jgi:hypothetical protein
MRIGDHPKRRLPPVRELPGNPVGGHGLDAHLRERLVMDEETMDMARMATTLGHDDPVRVGIPHGRLSPHSREVKGMDDDPRGIAMEVPSGLRGVSLSIATEMNGALAVEESSDVVDRLPERLAVQGIGGRAALGLQAVHQVLGRVFGGNVLDAQLGELPVVNEDVSGAARMAAAFGHDDPFRVGTSHDRLSLFQLEIM